MKHLRNYNDFKVNEELLGGIVNFFKKMWNKAVQEIEKLDNDPNKIKEWVINNAFNIKDDTNVFSQVLKEFDAKPTANDQDCLTLVDNILDPQTGSLGKQGIGVLLSNKAFQGENLKQKRIMLEYIINSARNQTIAKYVFAGGPKDGKVDPKKKNMTMTDKTHLPELKGILSPSGKTIDETLKKKTTEDWVKTKMIPTLQGFVKAIKEDDIREALKSQGAELSATNSSDMNYEKLKVFFDKKTPVLYLLKDKTKDEWNALNDEQKSKTSESPAKEIVGLYPIDSLNDLDKEDSVGFKGKDGAVIKKSYSDIIGPVDSKRGPNGEELAKKLGDIKSDEEKMKKVSGYVDFINNKENKDKIEEIDKIIGNEGTK
jgi:hypothetical protein